MPAGLDPSLSTEGLSLYKELGIDKKSSASEIKRAYHKKALRCHPDKVGNNDLAAAEQFKKINRANKILKDEKTRKIYDKMGSQGIAMMEQMGEQGPEVMEKFHEIFVKFSSDGGNFWTMEDAKKYILVINRGFQGAEWRKVNEIFTEKESTGENKINFEERTF